MTSNTSAANSPGAAESSDAAEASGQAALALPSELLTGKLEVLRAVMLAHLADPGEVLIDARSVTRVDSAGVQLLVAFVLELRRNQHPVRWLAPPPRLHELSRRLGVAQLLFADALPGAAVEAQP